MMHARDTITLNDTISRKTGIELSDTLMLNDTIAISDTIPEAARDEIIEKEAIEEVIDEHVEEKPVPSNWTTGGQTSVTFSQISLSNWTGGGQNSASFSSYFNTFLKYDSPDGRFNWENTLDIGYGLVNQEHRRTVKSDDKFDFSTKVDLEASESWSYSSLINFRTQMAPGYKSPGDTLKISNLMAPAFLNISVGMDHKFDDNISFYISPVAGRVIYVLDSELSERGAFGVEPGETKRYEFGGFIRIRFQATLMENISVNSRLELFSNYLDKPQNLNVNSDTRINMQINDHISANLVLHMIYNEKSKIKLEDGTEIGPRLEIKQVFGLGISYRF